MLQVLQKDNSINHVVRLLDSFVHAGPNGSHQCPVMELLGPSFEWVINTDYTRYEEHLEPNTILRSTK